MKGKFLTTLTALAVGACVQTPALAGNPAPWGGVICDLQTQAAEFVVSWNGSNGAKIISEINAEAGNNACAIGTWLLERDLSGVAIETEMGKWVIAMSTVYGRITPQGPQIAPVPIIQYAPKLVDKSEKALGLFPGSQPSSIPPKGRDAMGRYISYTP